MYGIPVQANDCLVRTDRHPGGIEVANLSLINPCEAGSMPMRACFTHLAIGSAYQLPYRPFVAMFKA
jgi:hypothetical protein